MEHWFEIGNADQIISPALLFYPDRIQHNIDRMIAIAGSADRLRPHVKTYKCPEIVSMQMKAGISKFKCATMVEAEMLAVTGVSDVLVAYPLIGPAQQKYIELTHEYPETKFSVLVDHLTQVHAWKKKALSPINVYVDIDVGMERTGIKADQAIDLIGKLDPEKFSFQGLQVYDGNVYDTNPDKRKEAVIRDFSTLDSLILHLKQQETPLEIVCGGSVTFPIHATYPERTLSPGTTLLWDYGYASKFPDIPFEMAAMVMSRIVSKPGKNKICLDLGHKSIGSEMSDLRVHFPQLPAAKRVVHSEEHLVLETEKASHLDVGDVLYGFPWHICPTVALHEKAAIIKNKQCIEYWDIVARKRIYQL